MYNNNFVATIFKVNKDKKFEFKQAFNSVIELEEGSEYGIRLTNKSTKQAVAEVKIDGFSVTGDGILIGAGDTVDLLRPVDKDKAFKLVSQEKC